MSETAEEDPFWSLVDGDEQNNEEVANCSSQPPLPSCSSTYTTKKFSISPKILLGDNKKQITPQNADKGDLKVYLGELKNDGCMSEIGGVMWEASVILCCFLLSNSKAFITSSVLELGAGVGVPGLLLAALKIRQLNKQAFTAEQQQIGPVYFTDYDDDVLDNIVSNIHHQFRPTCDIHFHHNGPSSFLNTPANTPVNPSLQVCVQRLDWTDDTYSRDAISKPSKQPRLDPCLNDRLTGEFDFLIGSELVYMSSLAALANVILKSLNGGAKEIVIIQMPSRSGFDDFMSLLGTYKKENKLDYCLECLSDELYGAAQQVACSADGLSLSFPEELLDPVTASSTAEVINSNSCSAMSSSRNSSSDNEDNDMQEGKDSRTRSNMTPVVTIPKDNFALLRIWRTGGGSLFTSSLASPRSLSTPSRVEISPEKNMESSEDASGEPRRQLSQQCRVATFNLNGRTRNCPHFVELLKSLNLDIICLQECPDVLAQRLKRGLGDPYECVYAFAGYCGNAILTRLPIKRSWTIEMRMSRKAYEMRSAAVAVVSLDMDPTGGDDNGGSGSDSREKKLEFCVCATHLCHLREDSRMTQLKQLLKQIETPCLILGDMNSLYEDDYTSQKWHRITDIRKKCRLTPPESTVMTHLMDKLRYRDCRTIHTASQSSPSRVARGIRILKEKLMTDNQSKENPMATSSYDTRVDWILLPPETDCLSQRIPFEVTTSPDSDSLDGYTVVPSISNKLTDHNLVMANLLFSIR